MSVEKNNGDLPVRGRNNGNDRHRIQVENAPTQEIIIAMGRNANPNGGFALVRQYEIQGLFSGIDLHAKRVFEIGCGTSPVTLGLRSSDMPQMMVASDVSLPIVNGARRLDARPRYLVCSAEEPPLQDGSMDLIVLFGVLHHRPPDSGMLKALRRLLSANGRLLLLEPNTACIPGRLVKFILKQMFGIVMEASPYGQFSRKQILEIVSRNGYVVEREWYVSTLAFPLTGDMGRQPVLPDSKTLFQGVIALDRMVSVISSCVPLFVRWLHWRVVFVLKPTG